MGTYKYMLVEYREDFIRTLGCRNRISCYRYLDSAKLMGDTSLDWKNIERYRIYKIEDGDTAMYFQNIKF